MTVKVYNQCAELQLEWGGLRAMLCTEFGDPEKAGRGPFQGYLEGKESGYHSVDVQWNLRSVAEERAGRKLGGLRVLNSYWINRMISFPVARFSRILAELEDEAPVFWN